MDDRRDPPSAAPPPGGEIQVLRFDREADPVRTGPHRHQHLQLVYVEAGRGTHRLGGRTYGAGAGDVVLVTPGLVHDATGLRETSGWSVEFAPQAAGLSSSDRTTSGPSMTLPRMWWANPLLAPFLQADQRRTAATVPVPPQDRPVWEAHLRIMHREHLERQDGYREMLAAYLTVALVALGRIVVGDHALRHPDPALSTTFEVIEQRYATHLSTSDVAAAVGLTPGHLTTLVRRRTGRTVGEWIAERRMAAARDLLIGTDLTVEQVAARVGYPDATYFSRRFRQAHGAAPGTWRAAARSGGQQGTAP